MAGTGFYMDRQSQVNPEVRPGGTSFTLPSAQATECGQSEMSFYEFNNCKSVDVSGMINGILAHEGHGTGGMGNGHEAQAWSEASNLGLGLRYDPVRAPRTLELLMTQRTHEPSRRTRCPGGRSAVLLIACLGTLLAAGHASAQAGFTCPTTDVEAMLEFFEAEFPRHETGRSLGSSCLAELFFDWARYPAEVERALDHLTELALGSDRFTRQGAVGKIGQAGVTRDGWPGVPGVFDRLMEIYRRTEDTGSRRMIVNRTPYLGDTTRAVEFLRGLAVQAPGEEDFRGAARSGVYRLSYLGAQGRAALQELSEQGAVREPRALLELRTLERRGFGAGGGGDPPGPQ